MTDQETKRWMERLAHDGAPVPMPDFELLWARRMLEQEFERRRRQAAPLLWLDAAVQGGAALAFGFLLVLLSRL